MPEFPWSAVEPFPTPLTNASVVVAVVISDRTVPVAEMLGPVSVKAVGTVLKAIVSSWPDGLQRRNCESLSAPPLSASRTF
jgi:hypothetical protein